MARKFTYEEVKYFIEIESDSGCRLLSTEYKNTSDKMLIQCKCGEEFTTTFSKFKSNNKRQCNKCSNCIQWNYYSVKSYIEKESNSGCILISNYYKNYKETLKLKCKCGNEFTTTFSRFLHKNQRECNTCRRKHMPQSQPKTQEKFVSEVLEMVGGEYSVLGNYVNSQTKILMLHDLCGHQWLVTPANFLYRKSRCPKCNGGVRKTQAEFESEVYELYKDEYEVIGEYKTYHKDRVKIRHNVCGNIYCAIPSVLLSGIGCNVCSESKGETAIREILEKYNVNYIKEKTFDSLIGNGGNLLRFDFYLPDYNLLIEYDGEFHFKKYFDDQNFEILKIHDNRKNQYCKENNIPLLRIPYWEFDKIEQILDKWLIKYQLIHKDVLEDVI